MRKGNCNSPGLILCIAANFLKASSIKALSQIVIACNSSFKSSKYFFFSLFHFGFTEATSYCSGLLKKK